ncbi:MAG: hypothetical protein M0Q53_20140 [Prolixibacteraceae bacterium]|jgi:hypothetical protein|nr:hypothetical protein [Prolixibacteraceae bacterium]
MSALDKAQFEFAQELFCDTVDKTIQNIKEAKTDELKIKFIIIALEALNAGTKLEGELFSGFYTAIAEMVEITNKLSNRIAVLEERLE